MSVSERIKSARLKLALSQAELAASVKISQETISKYERGVRKNISSSVLFEIAAALGVTPEYLQFGTRQRCTHDTVSELCNLVECLPHDAITKLLAIAKSLHKQL
jgi:transcriptional regulator with XRE-family HTH domain